MSTPLRQAATTQIGAVDARRVEDALSLIAPTWTTWITQTLAQHAGPQRVRDVAQGIPFISDQFIGQRLAQMQADGLVVPANDHHRAPYQLSQYGRALEPVHHALAEWSQEHLSLGTVARAERVENAVRRLHLRDATSVVQLLGTNGPMRFVRIAEAAGLEGSWVQQRLQRLQRDGLVTRSGPGQRDPYVLTDAGRALGPVYAAVQHWSTPMATPRPAVAPVAAATRTHNGAPLESDGIRTAAAMRRSPAAPAGLFSHAPQPQPRVPTAATAKSSPARAR